MQHREQPSFLAQAAQRGYRFSLALFVAIASCGVPATAQSLDNSGKVNDYDQWKQALAADLATAAGEVVTLPGFEVELLCSATPEQGSWIALAFDPQGRLTIAREDRGLLRLTLPKESGEEIHFESINEDLLECRGLLYAHGSLFANANNSRGLYRLRDTNGDDRFDEVKLLRESPGNVGHGRNNLALGPDGKIYSIHGNDTELPRDFLLGASPYRNFDGDRLLPCEWNRQLFNNGVRPPAGHVIRTDAEGSTWELVAGGMRNPFGIDFNADGEMFTFDADMEWDVGLPWYRPCRVNHLVSGGEYGWRQGTGKFAAWMPDSLPSNFDVGLASPTSVKFGTACHFPPQYQRALYICDWAYGRILAVHLSPAGASYSATAETFVRGRPLNVTGLAIGPDGAMYFTTGGRKTQAGLYRVKYTGPPEPLDGPPADVVQAAEEARALRHRLEAFHGRRDPAAVDAAWPHLGSTDLWIRFAARLALETRSATEWQSRALSETDPLACATALMALARVGEKSMQPALLMRLAELNWEDLSPDCQLIVARAYQLTFIRQGRLEEAALAPVRKRLEAIYPAVDTRVNQLLCELLVYVESENVVTPTLALLAAAKSQEEKIQYLFTLRHVRNGWEPAQRRQYFLWLAESESFSGARYVPQTMANIKAEALAALSPAEAKVLGPLLEVKVAPDPVVTADRPLVRAWTVDDLAGSLDEIGRGRNFARGKEMFAVATCSRCHKFGNEGKNFGPELSAVARRFGRRDLLESIVFPSKVIDDKYRPVMIATDDGRVLTGNLLGRDAGGVHIGIDPSAPEKTVTIAQDSIEAQQFSLVSPMPPGALNTLTKEEILDLLAYIESFGNPEHPSFKP